MLFKSSCSHRHRNGADGRRIPTLRESSEQIRCWIAQQVPYPARAFFIAKPAHNARRGAIELAANESSSAGKFIGDRLNASLQLIAVRIAPPAVIAQRLHACNTD